jgi:Xylose isomerase-like TIM barrel.
MRAIGFSTGALAKGDFPEGIALQNANPTLHAIELSALRDHELPRLASAAERLDLRHFEYVSFHAPGKLATLSEGDTLTKLSVLPSTWPIIVHPELLQTPALWKSLGPRLCLENMDNRKTTGRTLGEMRELLNAFPEAGFCLDLGHARQIDPTMATALRMAREFGARLRQLHVSEVGPRGEHLPLSALAIYAFQLVASVIPNDVAVIIESVIPANEIDREARKSAVLFGPGRAEGRSFAAALALAS